jgi:4-amino-4-deoxy-L-arabinose transferase-like glycosyltransferase
VRYTLIRRTLIITCVVCLTFFLFISVATVLNPYDLDSFEGILFTPALQLAKGGAIYGPQTVLSEPFMYATYGPLYYFILGLLLHITGVAFWPGRLISLLATAATAWVIYRAVRRASGGDRVAGLVAATLFIMMTPAFAFGALQRVDALGVLGATSAVALCFSPERRRNLFIAGCCAGLAFLTKPTFVAAGFAVAVVLLLTRRFRELGLFLVGGACVLAAAVALMAATHNGGYLFNLGSAKLPFAARLALTNVRAFLQGYAAFACLVMLAAGLTSFRRSRDDLPGVLTLTYLVITGAISVVASGRVGASTNYFYEFAAGLAIFAGSVFGKLESPPQALLRAAAGVLLAAALSLELVLFRSSFIQGRVLMPLHKAPLYAKLSQDILTLTPEGEPVASDYQEPVLRAGRPLYFNDLTMYLIGSEEMRSRLRQYLDEKRLAAVVTYQQRELPGYRLVKGYGYYSDPTSTTGQVSNGPFLYLREDLYR